MRIIVWDLEVALPVEDWDAAREGKCGIASLALYDSELDGYFVYGPETGVDDSGRCFARGPGSLGESLNHLNSGDLLVGFNSVEFDVPCVQAVVGPIVKPHYDILRELKNVLTETDIQRHWGLDALCTRTLGEGKTGSGELAPELFAQGRFAELLNYNLNDVRLTRKLFEHVCEQGFVIGPDGTTITLQGPRVR